jgi:hypothetical protein
VLQIEGWFDRVIEGANLLAGPDFAQLGDGDDPLVVPVSIGGRINYETGEFELQSVDFVYPQPELVGEHVLRGSMWTNCRHYLTVYGTICTGYPRVRSGGYALTICTGRAAWRPR